MSELPPIDMSSPSPPVVDLPKIDMGEVGGSKPSWQRPESALSVFGSKGPGITSSLPPIDTKERDKQNYEGMKDVGRRLKGVGEVGASFATGFIPFVMGTVVNTPVAMGVTTWEHLTGNRLKDDMRGPMKSYGQEMKEALGAGKDFMAQSTYQPKTEYGQQFGELVGKPFELPGKVLGGVGKKVAGDIGEAAGEYLGDLTLLSGPKVVHGVGKGVGSIPFRTPEMKDFVPDRGVGKGAQTPGDMKEMINQRRANGEMTPEAAQQFHWLADKYPQLMHRATFGDGAPENARAAGSFNDRVRRVLVRPISQVNQYVKLGDLAPGVATHEFAHNHYLSLDTGQKEMIDRDFAKGYDKLDQGDKDLVESLRLSQGMISKFPIEKARELIDSTDLNHLRDLYRFVDVNEFFAEQTREILGKQYDAEQRGRMASGVNQLKLFGDRLFNAKGTSATQKALRSVPRNVEFLKAAGLHNMLVPSELIKTSDPEARSLIDAQAAGDLGISREEIAEQYGIVQMGKGDYRIPLDMSKVGIKPEAVKEFERMEKEFSKKPPEIKDRATLSSLSAHPHMKLSEVLNHPDLYKRFPEYKDVIVVSDSSLSRSGTVGQTAELMYGGDKTKAPISRSMYIRMNPDYIRSLWDETVPHETQHLMDTKAGKIKQVYNPEYWVSEYGLPYEVGMVLYKAQEHEVIARQTGKNVGLGKEEILEQVSAEMNQEISEFPIERQLLTNGDKIEEPPRAVMELHQQYEALTKELEKERQHSLQEQKDGKISQTEGYYKRRKFHAEQKAILGKFVGKVEEYFRTGERPEGLERMGENHLSMSSFGIPDVYRTRHDVPSAKRQDFVKVENFGWVSREVLKEKGDKDHFIPAIGGGAVEDGMRSRWVSKEEYDKWAEDFKKTNGMTFPEYKVWVDQKLSKKGSGGGRAYDWATGKWNEKIGGTLDKKEMGVGQWIGEEIEGEYSDAEGLQHALVAAEVENGDFTNQIHYLTADGKRSATEVGIKLIGNALNLVRANTRHITNLVNKIRKEIPAGVRRTDATREVMRSGPVTGNSPLHDTVRGVLSEAQWLLNTAQKMDIVPQVNKEFLDKILVNKAKIVTDDLLSRVGKGSLKEVLEEVERSKLGLVSNDIGRVFEEYAKATNAGVVRKQLLQALRDPKLGLAEKLGAKHQISPGWQPVPSAAWTGWVVHPDMVPALKFMFTQNEPALLFKGLFAVGQMAKRIAVVGSLFHAKSLTEAAWGSIGPYWTVKNLGAGLVDTIARTKFSAITKAREMFQTGGLGDDLDFLMKNGLVLEQPEDMPRGLLNMVGAGIDRIAQKAGARKFHGGEKILGGVEHLTLGLLDKFTWDYLHTGLKASIAIEKMRRASLAHPDTPLHELAQEVSKNVNANFGGLNWYDVATDTKNHTARTVMLGLFNRDGRMVMQSLLFAPDWTISTVTSFSKSLGHGTGLKGLWKPKTAADFARQYQLRVALTYLTLINGLNIYTSRHPLWQNNDPTSLDMGDGTRMQLMKHAAEPYHWLLDPRKTLTNKLGFGPKLIALLMDRKKNNEDLLRELFNMWVPFSLESLGKDDQGKTTFEKVSGSLGIPVYGKKKVVQNSVVENQ